MDLEDETKPEFPKVISTHLWSRKQRIQLGPELAINPRTVKSPRLRLEHSVMEERSWTDVHSYKDGAAEDPLNRIMFTLTRRFTPELEIKQTEKCNERSYEI
ncbi:unnamed protein product [Bursaphelenchus xylophilus]|uniref:(pine wood nematode) hypothetical protein n=1 Tax=Bursaphelenchus xylophilus TaxID=6326 RepID=A0A7I8X724_BURXY|nr:unnamed protein product [Bursaphelenchus xylophilus]CAG9122853.1 unnamed protein product [Bursaphelenchus xylophilus]